MIIHDYSCYAVGKEKIAMLAKQAGQTLNTYIKNTLEEKLEATLAM